MPIANRAGVAALMTFIASVAFGGAQSQAQLPTGKAIRIIYAFAPGDSGDAIARLLAQHLTARLGIGAIVENRAGASGRIGTKAVIAAEPDGTTLLMSPMGPMAIHPLTYTNLDFDPFTDLEPVSHVAGFDIALVIAPDHPSRSLPELVAWLKANPAKANYGTPGLGGLPHFFAMMFAASAQVTLHNVPYRGAAAVVNDVVAGQLPIAFSASSNFAELHQSGRLRILATSGDKRSPLLPEVPTFIEQGFAINGEGWYGMFAPARTPRSTIEQLSMIIQDWVHEAETSRRILGLGSKPTGTSSEQFRRIHVGDRDLWAPAVKASGFKPSD